MRDVLTVPTYLAVQGFQYTLSRSDDPTVKQCLEKRLPLTKELARHAATTPDLIGWLNLLAHTAWDDSGRHWENPPQPIRRRLPRSWQTFLKTCVNHGLLIQVEERTVCFPDQEAARFLGGGWLETYSYASAKKAGLRAL